MVPVRCRHCRKALWVDAVNARQLNRVSILAANILDWELYSFEELAISYPWQMVQLNLEWPLWVLLLLSMKKQQLFVVCDWGYVVKSHCSQWDYKTHNRLVELYLPSIWFGIYPSGSKVGTVILVSLHCWTLYKNKINAEVSILFTLKTK